MNDSDLITDELTVNEVASLLVSRLKATGNLGLAFEGKRDYYKVLGYKRELVPQDYINAYLRDEAAGRIVDLPVDDCWIRQPVLIDGDERSDDKKKKPKSKFLQAWGVLEDMGILRYLKKVDKLQRLGRYGVILLGVNDKNTLDQPIARRLNGPGDLLYLKPKPETMAQITTLDTDTNSKRFGKPLIYNVELGSTEFGSGIGMGVKAIHHSRILHVVEDSLDNDVLGIPILLRAFNRLSDFMKVVGGSSEAFWKNIRGGLAFVAPNGAAIGTGPNSKDDLKAQIEEYDMGLRRILTLGGVEPHMLESMVVDPKGMFDVLISCLSLASGIPARILVGSERGELASSQDMVGWNNTIQARQIDHVEPNILRAFISWAIQWGIMQPPLSGSYDVEWGTVFSLSEIQKSEMADKLSVAIQRYVSETGAVNVVGPNEFRERVLGWPPMSPEEIQVDPEFMGDDLIKPPQQQNSGEENTNLN